MEWLDPVRQVVQPWYAAAPRFVIIGYSLLAVLAGFGVFQLIFVVPPKGAAAPPTQNISNTGGGTQQNVIYNGTVIQQLTIMAPATPPPSPQVTPAADIVENGSFERGLEGWGTGFFESHFMRPGQTALIFGGASARWSIDETRAHTGRRATLVEHFTTQAPHVFSSFSQRVKVAPGRRYTVTFWAYLAQTDGRGSFSLRVLPSRAFAPEDWDRFRRKVDPGKLDQWQEVTREFDSGGDSFFDLRFAAETATKIWIDDVSVRPLSEG
jgi:carbohydrate binding protein with CBM4/9 domain